jgi:hypothetical protein
VPSPRSSAHGDALALALGALLAVVTLGVTAAIAAVHALRRATHSAGRRPSFE